MPPAATRSYRAVGLKGADVVPVQSKGVEFRSRCRGAAAHYEPFGAVIWSQVVPGLPLQHVRVHYTETLTNKGRNRDRAGVVRLLHAEAVVGLHHRLGDRLQEVDV